MAFLVKNKGNVVGTALIDGSWVQIEPGQSAKAKFKPRHTSVGLVVVEAIKDPSVKKTKPEVKSDTKTSGKKE